MAYRAAALDPKDREPEAAAELRRRARSVRRRAAAAGLIAPLLGAFPGYFLVQELERRLLGGASFPVLSGLVGVGLPLFLGLRATAKLTRRSLRRWREPWLDEVAATYKVPRKDLVKYTTPWHT